MIQRIIRQLIIKKTKKFKKMYTRKQNSSIIIYRKKDMYEKIK